MLAVSILWARRQLWLLVELKINTKSSENIGVANNQSISQRTINYYYCCCCCVNKIRALWEKVWHAAVFRRANISLPAQSVRQPTPDMRLRSQTHAHTHKYVYMYICM